LEHITRLTTTRAQGKKEKSLKLNTTESPARLNFKKGTTWIMKRVDNNDRVESLQALLQNQATGLSFSPSITQQGRFFWIRYDRGNLSLYRPSRAVKINRKKDLLAQQP